MQAAGAVAIDMLPRDPIELPPCSHQCGNTAFSGIDYTFFFFEIVSAVGILVSGAEGEDAGLGISVGALVCFGVGHCLVRKYGNIAVVAAKFNDAQRQYVGAVDAQAVQIKTLSGDVERFTKANADLEQQRGQWQAGSGKMGEELQGAQRAVADLQSANQKLEEANGQLTAKVADLEKLTESMQQRIRDFTAQNAAFRSEIQKVSKVIPALSQVAGSLKPSVVKLGQQVDADIGELQAELQTTQQVIQQIVETLQKNRDDLETQLVSLESEHKELQGDVTRLQQEREKFQSASASAEQTIKRLTDVQSTLEQRIAALADGSHDLQSQTSELTSLLAQIRSSGQSMHDSASGLHAASSALSADEHAAAAGDDGDLDRQVAAAEHQT